MAGNLELLIEAERRGILPPERKAALDEARRRGLIEGAAAPAAPQEEPSTLAKIGRGVDDAVRSVASGLTFGLADELAAAASSATGIGDRGGYDANLAAERQRDREIPAAIAIPGEIAGGVATGMGLARGGLTMLNAARPTVGNMALRGAGEGAVYGAAHGFGHGEGGAENRLVSAGTGAALGTATGGATGAITGRLVRPKAPTTEAVKQAGSDAYKAAEKAGVVLNPASFDNVIADIASAAEKAGIDKSIHPKATAGLARALETVGQPLTLERAEILRRVLKGAASSNEADERRIAQIMVDKLDDHVEKLSPADVLAGDAEAGAAALSRARKLWSQARKAETVDELIERAGTRAGQFTGSGFENALRTEFRGLAMNKKRLRTFTKDEQATIKKVAEGGAMENALRMVGKLAPRGVVSGGFHLGVGAVGGFPLSAGTMATGELARRGATAMTLRNARQASEAMRGGRPPAAPLSPQQQAIVEAIIQAEAQQVPALARRGGLEIELTDPGNRRTPNPLR